MFEQPASKLFAEIIVPLALPKNYTWGIPPHLSFVKVGCRVEVNLGRSKKYAGVVKKIHESKPSAFEPKDILNVLDEEPIVFKEQLNLWEWIANYYMCSEGEVMAAALPAHYKLNSETILLYNEEYGDDFTALSNNEFIIAEALLIKKQLKTTEVQELLDVSHAYPVIKKLIDKRVCYVWEALKSDYKSKKESYVILNPEYNEEVKLEELLNNWGKAARQLELLLGYLHLYKTEGEVIKSALLKKTNTSDAQLNALIEKKILWIEKREVDRLKYLPKSVSIDFELSSIQQNALVEIKDHFKEKNVALLHGVTASGKTQIYIRLIEEWIKKGLQVLYLLPEIALTSQIIRKLQRHFGGHIAVYHSKFSQNERIEIWNKIKSREISIVLGARSALFMPFQNLGLIIVDEEHDSSFKQHEPSPRYHGRDAAIFYASQCNAKILLGSATPSVETYHNANSGKYGLVSLLERYGGVELPAIEVVDLKLEPRDRKHAALSERLEFLINESLQRHKQVILFQNRRGYAPYQVCNVCDWVPQCSQCDVSLTYHKLSNQLKCHYCGTVYPVLTTCAACGSNKLVQKNFGTEKIEEILEEVFSDAKVSRMDIDTVKGKYAHDALIQLFEQQRIDVLVGTQMVVKGLDFEHVNLVGILDADSILNFSDFRANERAFQLMEQVSGRAGRRDGAGLVVVQAKNINHPVLQFVRQHSYQSLYDFEIVNRKRFFYPPYSRLVMVSFKHKNQQTVNHAAEWFTGVLKDDFGKYIIGPAEPVVNRVRNQYIMELLLKLPKDTALIQSCKLMIKEKIIELQSQKNMSNVVVIPNVDVY